MDVKQLFENFKQVVTEHYFDFNGRTARTTFWYYVVVYVAIIVVLSLIRLRFVANIVALGLLLPSLGIAVRRLHDVGQTGWLVALPIIPAVLAAIFTFVFFPLGMLFNLAALACAVYLIYLYAQPGEPGSNQFGAPPNPTAP